MRSVGDKISGRYEIVSVIGERPLWVVYRAVDLDAGVDVALRVLSRGLLPDEGARQAFVQKLSRGKSMSHPNVVRLYDVVTAGEDVIVSVQWAPGVTLAQRIFDEPLDLVDARPMIKQLQAGISHAHQHGVVLGDVRTDSLVVLENALKLSNVGIGLALPRARYLEAMRDTPAWPRLAPELRNGLTAEPRADVYAMAVATVEMLTGKLPEPSLTIPDAPAPLLAVLGRALSEDPMLRQPSAEVLGQEIESVLSGGVVVQRSPSARDSSRTPLLPILAPAPTPTPTPAPVSALPSLGDEDEGRPAHDELTRQVDEHELDRLRGAEVTRVVSEEEIFPLRLQSSETQQVDSDMIVRPDEGGGDYEELELEAVPQADGTVRLPLPARNQKDEEEIEISQVILLEPDAAKTVPVPRIEPEMPPPPPPIPVADAPPVTLPRAASPENTGTPTPLPPPIPAPPAHSANAEDFGDETLATKEVRKLAPEEVTAGNDLPPRARELVVPDPKDRPPTPDPSSFLPKIQVDISVGRTATPPKGVPAVPLPVEAPLVLPRAPVAPPPVRPPMSTGLLAIVVMFLVAVSGIVIGVVHHVQALKLEHDRVEKQRLADELRARAEALRHAPATPSPPSASVTAPVVSHPDVAPVASGPCPPGANLITGGRPFCVDVYEYPGGKTMPRTGVSFDEAERLCKSRGERLCTDVEWERACRGKGHSSFPYGSAFEPGRCNLRTGTIAPAGEFKECRSAAGAYDMSGNVAEWVSARGQPAQKGGSTGAPASRSERLSRCSTTVHAAASESGVFIGFRCCADPASTR
jgi:serine/threonine protein kinase